ncbi:hypothetical protein ADM96_10015 [Burkholderia sp. ST111]|nr:hypothetical protein ADM96_10015 [Burkholderia sp. ST111]
MAVAACPRESGAYRELPVHAASGFGEPAVLWTSADEKPDATTTVDHTRCTVPWCVLTLFED